MATEVRLPQWGMEMAEGTIVKWLKKEGDAIKEGEPLVEVETAKIDTELESIASGILAHILVPEGETIPIRTVLAVIAEPGEQVPRPQAVPSSLLPTTQPTPISASAATPAQERPNVQVVPAARRLAQQHGIELGLVQGSGPRGRILIADVEHAIAEQARPADQEVPVVPIVGMRRTIATRMLQSLQTMAQVTLTTEADVTDAMTLREGLARQWSENGLSPLHLVIKATAQALKDHPRLNALQDEDQVRLMDQVNIGVAVSLAEGLLTPVVRDVDQKSLAEIAREAHQLAIKTREGKARPEDVTGGTFTITNLGTYDIDAFTPIINPPQVAILGVGRAVDKPVIKKGQITQATMMFISLTFDHRVVDGAPAAEFLQAVKGRLEDPWWMVA
ncbi:MAG: dihydrolipoamide acetyltransferase family protein [Chloroflexi bacterium]|nr:dihydrolipoamide acetyltransferase family protein [Chloroflexota bacterium]